MKGFFITGTGTGVGKTYITSALTYALRDQGKTVAALKPVETGCDPVAHDAEQLALTSGIPSLSNDPQWIRLRAPLAPSVASVIENRDLPSIESLADHIHQKYVPHFDVTLVEGAGGLLVPYREGEDFSHFAVALDFPLIIVAANRLGIIHDTRATVEAALHRGLSVYAIILSSPETGDQSHLTNAEQLRNWVTTPIIECSFGQKEIPFTL